MSRFSNVDTAASDLGRTVRLPLDVEVKVTSSRGDWSGYARVVNESRGNVELMGSGKRGFPRSFAAGGTVMLLAEVDDARIVVEARIQSCTATYLKVVYVGYGESLARRRRHVRVEMSESVYVLWTDASGRKAECRGTLTDLSVGGCQLRVDRELPEGTELRIPLRLDTAVELRGAVVRLSVKPNKISVGVQFDDMETVDRAAVVRFMARRTRGSV